MQLCILKEGRLTLRPVAVLALIRQIGFFIRPVQLWALAVTPVSMCIVSSPNRIRPHHCGVTGRVLKLGLDFAATAAE